MKDLRLCFLAALLLLGLAACGPPQVELNVQLTGDGFGAVTSEPPGLSCSAEVCTGRFDKGTRVKLEPEPGTNSGFVAWGGACEGNTGCEVVMDAPKAVEAGFERTQFVLKVTRTGAATGKVVSTPTGIDCGEACEDVRKRGIQVSLEAFPADGAVFGGWGGDCSGNGLCFLTFNTDLNVVANFTFPAPIIDSFSADPTSILLGQRSTLQWSAGGKGTVELTVSPNVGDVTGQTSITVRPSGTTTYTLKAESEFGSVEEKVRIEVRPSADLAVKVNGSGMVESLTPVNTINCDRSGGDCAEIFDIGTDVTLQATSGNVEKWEGCDQPQGNTCTLKMTVDKTVTVTF